MSHDKHHGHDGHDKHDKCDCSAKPGQGDSFGTEDTGKDEQKEWMDGLSDDE